MITVPAWSARGVTVRPTLRYAPEFGITIDTSRAASLSPELMRSLRDWLSWHLADRGESPPPANLDAVRVAIDEQRAALAELSTQDVSHDFRAGLAWANNALDAINRAAGGAR